MRRGLLLLLVPILVYLAWFEGGSDHPTEAYGFPAHCMDYYNLLAEGMQQGHLWMNLPYDPTPGVDHPFVNDASLYHNHYYIYFGPTPVVLLFLPCLVLTGHEMPTSFAILLFVAAGLLFQVAVVRDVRRRYAPRLSAPLEAVVLLLVAFGASTPILMVVHQIYEVAVAGAYCFVSLAWLCLYRALHQPSSPLRWLAGASLAIGLAVGCRPDFILLLTAVAAAALWLARFERAPGRRARIAFAALVPAAAIGAGLGAYNAARFGRVGEFGQTYQANEMAGSHLQMLSVRFIPENLGRYLLRPPELTPYFPYVLPLDTTVRPAGYFGYETVHGHWVVGLLALLTIVALVLGLRRERPIAPLGVFLVLAGGGALEMLFFIGAFGSSADRYAVDFLGTLVLAIAVAASWAIPRLGRLPGILFAILSLGVVADHVLFPYTGLLYLLPGHPSMEAIYRLGNYPSFLAGKAGLIHYGPRRLEVAWADHPHATIEPLLSSGSNLGRDTLESVQEGPDRVRFIVDLGLSGSVSSTTQLVAPGKTHVLEVDMGSFYPPRFHPYFDGWTPTEIDTVKTATRVVLDGKEIIRTRLPYHDSPPGNLLPGVNPEGHGSEFSGRIISYHRMNLRDPLHDPAFVEPGVWRVRLEPNIRVTGLCLPVLSGGTTGAGDQLLLKTGPDHRVAFGIDTWGRAVEFAEPIATGPDYHLVEIFSGAQVLAQHPDLAARLAPATAADLRNRLVVWWDGRLAASFQLTAFQDCFAVAALGANSQGFSSTQSTYAGGFKPDPFSEAETQSFIARNLAELKITPR